MGAWDVAIKPEQPETGFYYDYDYDYDYVYDYDYDYDYV